MLELSLAYQKKESLVCRVAVSSDLSCTKFGTILSNYVDVCVKSFKSTYFCIKIQAQQIYFWDSNLSLRWFLIKIFDNTYDVFCLLCVQNVHVLLSVQCTDYFLYFQRRSPICFREFCKQPP